MAVPDSDRRARPRPAPPEGCTEPCPPSSSPAPPASSAATSSPSSSGAATASSRSSARPRPARPSCDGSPPALAANVELRTGDVLAPETLPAALAGVDAVVHLVAIPRDWNGGKELLRVNLGGTQSLIAAMEAAGVRRLVHLGALGVEDREELNYAKSKARAERAVARKRPRLDDPQAVAPVRAPRRLLQHRRRPRADPGPARPRAGGRQEPLPAAPRRRSRPLPAACPGAARDDRPGLRAGRSPHLDVPRDHRGGDPVGREAADHRSHARARSSGSWPGTAELLRLRFFPVATDQLRQLALDNVGPLDGVYRAFGFVPRKMEGELLYLRNGKKKQEPAPAA